MNNQIARETIEEIVGTTKLRYKNELEGEVDEILPRLARRYQAVLSRLGWKAAQQWCKWENNGPILMPDNTRMYYRKGNSELIIREFPPKIHLLRFKGDLVHKKSPLDPVSERRAAETHSYSLALPYLVFLFRFVDGVFVDLKLAFSDRPLKKLRERPLKPYLANINEQLSVCLGLGLDKDSLKMLDINEQSNYVLNYFWQSVFRDELADHYWYLKHHFEEASETRLVSLDNWQKASLNDPLFVIDGSLWLAHGDETFGDMLTQMLSADYVDIKYNQALYDAIEQEFMKEVLEAVRECVANADKQVKVDVPKYIEKLTKRR